MLRRLADPGSQRDAGLGSLLAGAPDLAAAVDVTLEYLLAWDLPMPSLYLARGDRLRCLGQRGYWQVQDGLPIGAGVCREHLSKRPVGPSPNCGHSQFHRGGSRHL